jgi:hypothetical protein
MTDNLNNVLKRLTVKSTGKKLNANAHERSPEAI